MSAHNDESAATASSIHMNDEQMLEPAVPFLGPLVRVRMLLSYDGAPFHGFAFQGADVPTVAGVLRVAMSRLVGYEPELTVAGRTDTGVHAWGQVVSLDVPASVLQRFDFLRIRSSLNKQLAPHVVVRSIERAAEDFDARFSATSRAYRYSVLTSEVPSPFLANTVWHIPARLDLDAMNEACVSIVGEHDFSSFCRRPPGAEHLNRRITSAEWIALPDDLVQFRVEAKAFCHQMVRSLTGTLVEIGLRKRPPSNMAEVLAAQDRQKAATPAPPQGLCLWEVGFD